MQNLRRLRQFYETCRDRPIVSTLLQQLPWSHSLAIMSRRPSAFCSARRKTARLSNTHSAEPCPRPSWPSTKSACPTRNCCKPSFTSSTNWPKTRRPSPPLSIRNNPNHEGAARNDRTRCRRKSRLQSCDPVHRRESARSFPKPRDGSWLN